MSTLLVASAGGHLKELYLLRTRLSPATAPFSWATFDTPQARSLLASERVVYARYPRPRDAPATIANGRLAWRLLRSEGFERVISTGSGIAVSFLPMAAAMGSSCHYIESATRTDGPSLTARLLAALPGTRLYTQDRSWASRRWLYRGSVFDGFVPAAGRAGSSTAGAPIGRIVVTVGSSQTYGFRRLIEAMTRIVPPGSEVLWQTGPTDVSGLGIEATPMLASAELDAWMAKADVVVCHAGVGSVLAALEAGKIPVLVPRRSRFGEHVDDHQGKIASMLSERGLAIVREAGELSADDLVAAASGTTALVHDQLPFDLGP